MSERKIVILRPEEDAGETIEAVKACGYEPLVEPVLRIEYPPFSLPALEDGTPLIFTSAHGVRAYDKAGGRRDLPVYTVGRNTADAARAAGFTQIESALGTAADMVDLFTSPLKMGLKTPLYVRAEDVSADLQSVFGEKGLQIDQVIAYRAILAEKLSINLLKSLDRREIKAIMFFSARGAANFASLIAQYDRTARMKPIQALCIGTGMIESLSALPFAAVTVAETPDRPGMHTLLAGLERTDNK